MPAKRTTKKHIKDFLSPTRRFSETVGLTRTLLDEGIISIRIPVPGEILFRVDEQRLRDYEEKHKTPEDYRKILNNEIAKLLEGFLHSDPTAYAAMVITQREDLLDKKFDRIQVQTYLKRRIDLVGRTFDVTSLKERNTIRRTTKVGYVQDLEWAISLKKHDLEEGDLGEIPYCTVRMTFKKPAVSLPIEGGPHSIQLFFDMIATTKSKDVSYDLHLLDVEELIEELGIVRDNLKRIISGDI